MPTKLSNVDIAKHITDTAESFTFETPVCITTSGQIQKTVNTSVEVKYFSNIGSVVTMSNGGDDVTIDTPVLDLDTIALLSGQGYDPTTKALITGNNTEVHGALLYREQLSDDSWRYVVKYNVVLSDLPEEISQTRSDGVNTNGQQLKFKCNKTVHEFHNVGHVDGIELDERDDACDFSTFFDTVYTPDTIGALAKAAVTALTLDAASASLVIGGTATLTATVAPTGSPVRWVSSNANVASVSGGVVTAHAVGVAIITATAGSYSAQCTVTVSTE